MSRPKGSKNKVQEKPVHIADLPIKQEVAITPIQPQPLVRKYGPDGSEMCLSCNHSSNMHHEWEHIRHYRTYKDQAGRDVTKEWTEKVPKFDGIQKRPCQHACNCWEFK